MVLMLSCLLLHFAQWSRICRCFVSSRAIDNDQKISSLVSSFIKASILSPSCLSIYHVVHHIFIRWTCLFYSEVDPRCVAGPADWLCAEYGLQLTRGLVLSSRNSLQHPCCRSRLAECGHFDNRLDCQPWSDFCSIRSWLCYTSVAFPFITMSYTIW